MRVIMFMLVAVMDTHFGGNLHIPTSCHSNNGCSTSTTGDNQAKPKHNSIQATQLIKILLLTRRSNSCPRGYWNAPSHSTLYGSLKMLVIDICIILEDVE